VETRGAHLTFGQIILLLRPENEPGGPPNNLEEHLRICPECRELKEQCEATMAEVNAWDGNASVPIDCPAAEVWTQFAARLLSRERLEELLEHLSACDHCGVLLKEALEDIQSDAPPAPEIHGKLKTSKAKQQGRIAREILDRRIPENGGLAGSSSASAFFHRLTPRAALLTAVLLVSVAVALGWFFWPRSDSVEKLLSLAYAKKRTLELRIPGAAYGPVQAQRASGHTQHDNPAALLHAELIIKNELEEHPDNPDLLRQQAEADLLNWDFQPAIETLGQAIRVQPTSALLLVDLASAHFERAEASDSPADYETALEYLGQAIRVAPNDHAALFNRAVIYERLFLYDPAIADWEKLLSLEKDPLWRNEEESRLRDLRLKKQHPRSNGHSLQPLNAIELEQALRHPDEADAEEYIESAERELLPNISRRDMKDSDYPAAILVARYLEQAHSDRFLSDILQSAGAPEFHPAARLLGEAVAANNAGLSEQALTHARQSERLFQQTGSAAGVLAAKFEQAYALHFQSQAGPCATTASKTAALAQKHNYPWLQTQSLLEEAMCNIMKNDLGPAKILVNRAIQIAETHHYQGFYLRGLLVLGYLEADAGDETSAWSAIRRGLQIYWAGRFRPVRGYSFYTVLETVAERLGHDSVQYAAAVQALSFIGDNPNRIAEAATRSRLAAVALRLGETKIAENELATAVQLFSAMPQTASVRWRVIWAKVWQAKAQAAQNSYRGDVEVTLQSLSPEVEQLANRVLSFEYYSTLGEIQSQQGKVQEAERSLEVAIKLAESSLPSLRTWQEQLTEIRQLRRPYLLLTDIMFRSGQQKAALELWQRFRLAEAGFSREPDRSQRAAASASFERPASYRGQPSDTSTILTYVLTDEALIIWARENNGLHSVRVSVPIADLRRVAENFLGECSRPDSDLSRLRADARVLYEWLIRPVSRWLPPTGHIIVEPDGILSMLPFNALVDESEAYWGARYSITMSLSAGGNQVPASSVSVRSSDRALLVAAPAPPGRSVEASTEAHREVDQLASKFLDAEVLAGHDATVGALKKKLGAARIFHFAGHATVGRDGAEIVMADGIVGIAGKRLRAGMVLDLSSEKDLLRNTRLAVFSACATAKPSEALQADSLVTEFIRAGVPWVTASRWNVDSVATTSFMVSFYDSLLSGHTVDGALQIAASQVRASSAWIHPYYWAAFGAFGHS